MTPEEVNQQKEVEFYAASVNAWYNTALEHDKSIFTLSAGGIGLLITLLTITGVTSSALLHLYIGAIVFFLLCLCTLLVVFRRNKVHIVQVLNGQNQPDAWLTVLDVSAMVMFAIGVSLTAIIGISAAVETFNKGKAMANEKDIKQSGWVPSLESFNDLASLRSSVNGVEQLQRSFQGVASLRPQQQTTTQTTGTTSSGGAATPTQPANSSGSGSA